MSLKRRPEKREAFRNELQKIGGFDCRFFDAIDGQNCTPPAWWRAGGGAWGCYRSHLQILENCLNEGVQSVLIFEDDAVFRPDFREKAERYEAAIPETENAWIYYGGQHIRRKIQEPRPINAEVWKPFNVNRTHAWAIRGREMMLRIYRHLTRNDWQTAHHIDHHLGRLCEAMYREDGPVFCPAQWLVDQRGGFSDVAHRAKPDIIWPGADVERNALGAPFYAVLGLHSSGSSALAGALYCLGVHLGNKLVGMYGRPPINGGEAVDLRNLYEKAAPVPTTRLQLPAEEIRARLKNFVDRRRAEAVKKATVAAGKYPQMAATWDILRDILGDRLRLIISDRPLEKSIDSLQRRFMNLPAESVEMHQRWLYTCIQNAAGTLPPEHVHRVNYEEMKAAPKREIERLINFMRLDVGAERVRAAAAYIDPTKDHHAGI